MLCRHGFTAIGFRGIALWMMAFILLIISLAPALAETPPAAILETDALTLSWSTLRRLSLQAGFDLPPYRPLSHAELITLLDRIAADDAPALADLRERRELATLYRTLDSELPESILSAPTFGTVTTDVSEHSGWLMAGRVGVGTYTYGDVVASAAGYGPPTGWSSRLELSLSAWWRRWWVGVTPRLQGRFGSLEKLPSDGLLYPDWNRATGRRSVRETRLSNGVWRLDWPRGVVGVRMGHWSLAAGWAASRTGPGTAGTLVLTDTAPSFPAITARRTAPFAWRGFLRHIAPEHLLLRVGVLSRQTVEYWDDFETVQRENNPWFFQWLITFKHTSWLRTTITSGAMAIARNGTLWPDLLQINFPLLTATWAEVERGPVTDRIFALQFEARFRHAPWPLLPAAAGRLYWEYGGEDFRPQDEVKVLPQISAPASVAGVELVSPRWDLACEYADLRHAKVLWYDHNNFLEGYSHRGWVLGHPLGGSGRSLQGWLRWRPRGTTWEFQFSAARRTWGQTGLTVGRAERTLGSVTLSQLRVPLLWKFTLEWIDEAVTQFTSEAGATGRDRWILAWLTFGL